MGPMETGEEELEDGADEEAKEAEEEEEEEECEVREFGGRHSKQRSGSHSLVLARQGHARVVQPPTHQQP